MIDARDPVPRITVRVAEQMYSVAVAGVGPPVVLLHGSVTSAYSWRNVIRYLARGSRCLAPDLAGMGRTATFPFGLAFNSFEEQYSSLAKLVDDLEPSREVVLIGHELGAAMAVQYARENPSSVAGLVLVEGVFRVSNDAIFAPDLADFLAEIRTDSGEDMILGGNLAVEYYLGRLTLRHLGPEEMRAYRQPTANTATARQAMLTLIRDLPVRSHPGRLGALAEELRVWCRDSAIPKLVVGGKPGFLVPTPILATTARWANTTTRAVHGLHFLMEDSPTALTSSILDWLVDIGHVQPAVIASPADAGDVDGVDE